MTRQEIHQRWKEGKHSISIEELCPVNRTEPGEWEIEVGHDFLQYAWYLCPNDSSHLSFCTREGASWSGILNCVVCQKQWLLTNDIVNRVRNEEKRFFEMLERYAPMLAKHNKGSLTGKKLAELHHTHGLVPDVVGAICDVTFSESTLKEYQAEWADHCLSGKNSVPVQDTVKESTAALP